MGATVRLRPERGTWEVYFFDRGRRWQKSLGKGDDAQADAEAIAAAFNESLELRDLREERLSPGAPAPFEHIATAWWDAVAPSRPASSQVAIEPVIHTRLVPFFGSREIRSFDEDLVRAFVVDQVASKRHARETIETSLSILRRILNWAVERGVLQSNPVPRLMEVGRAVAAARAAPRRKAPAWSKDEVRALLEVCARRGPWLHDLVLFAAQQGCRRGEIIALEWTDVDLTLGRATILQSESRGQRKSAKADKVRTIELTPGSIEMLRRRAWDQFRDRPFEQMERPGRVFLDRWGKPWVDHSLNGYWSRARRVAHAERGVRPFKFHAFRHTWATWALAAGEDAAWCADQIGDTLEVFLRRYAHAMPGKRRTMEFADLSEPHGAAPPEGPSELSR